MPTSTVPEGALDFRAGALPWHSLSLGRELHGFEANRLPIGHADRRPFIYFMTARGPEGTQTSPWQKAWKPPKSPNHLSKLDSRWPWGPKPERWSESARGSEFCVIPASFLRHFPISPCGSTALN